MFLLNAVSSTSGSVKFGCTDTKKYETGSKNKNKIK